jgi:hypothetical protein
VVVLSRVAVARRRPRRARRAREREPSPAPTLRATLIDAVPLPSVEAADEWLAGLRSDPLRLTTAVEEAARDLNSVLRAHRLAAADPYAPEIASDGAIAVRVGHGSGEEVADGEFAEALEVPGERRGSRRGELLAPQERLARILGGREAAPPSEELILRARADLAATRPREAALQARVALEALLAELAGAEGAAAEDRRRLEAARAGVAEAAGAALRGEPSAEALERVAEAVALMAAAVRRRALGAAD